MTDRSHAPPILTSLATANPPLYVTQREAFEHYDRLFDLAADERALYRRLLLDGPVKGRFIGMDSVDDARQSDQDHLVRRYLKYARKTASDAGAKALTRAGLVPEDLGGLVVNSCTGYLCPGLTSYISEDIGLPSHVRSVDLVGMGCGGALPNLEVAMGMLARDAEKPVLSIAVEICTATLFMGSDPGLIVSNAIFGDGAAAAILTHGARPPENRRTATLLAYQSGLFPQYREHLQYRTEDHRLRNVLSARVPVLGAETVHQVATRLLEKAGLSTGDIRHWAVHPGGTAVLDRVARRFGLQPTQLQQSYNVFEAFGNMSSPSVLFVLERILEHDQPQPGDKGLLLAFGAGFTAFALLVEF